MKIGGTPRSAIQIQERQAITDDFTEDHVQRVRMAILKFHRGYYWGYTK
jgi:hypothetical protein